MYRLFLLFFGVLLFPEIGFAVETEIGEVDNFGDFISQIWAWATQVIFGVSVIVLIVGGILYMAAAGDDEKIDTAKQVIQGALVSTVLMLFSGVLFAVLQKPAATISDPTLLDATFVLENIASMLLGIVGGVSAVALIYNGIQYMLAAGDLEKIDIAKRGLTFSVIGLIISVSAYGILGWVVNIF